MLNLPDEMLYKIREDLGQKEANRLTRTCHRLHSFFQNDVDTPLLNDLQNGVVYAGKDEELEKELEPIMKNRPDLLFRKLGITDGARRTFNCSLWQYMIWSKDWHRWSQALPHIPKELYAEAYQQLLELATPGREHGPCYDARPLKKALESYEQKYQEFDFDNQPTNEKEAILVELWCKGVGGAQRGVSVALANQYCRNGRSFYPCPDFEKDTTLPRKLKFDNWLDESVWFPLLDGLGSDFAIRRGRRGCAEGATVALGRAGEGRRGADLVEVTAWDEVGTKKLLALKQFLKSELEHKNTPAQSPSSGYVISGM